MNIKRTLTLALVTAAGVVAVAQPASASDGRDFLIWQRGYGSTTAVAGDANSDSTVDAADYVVWRKTF